MQKLVLASKSPRRKQLLEWAEIPFEIITQDTPEDYPEDLDATEIPVHIARSKARAVYNWLDKDRTVLAADTVVVLNGEIIGKPVDREDAIKILAALSGKQHLVITGVVLIKNGSETAFADITKVSFHVLSYEQICFYVDKYKPYDKAGAYAIQEWIGVTGIKSIEGDFYNVMGLPVSRVVKALES